MTQPHYRILGSELSPYSVKVRSWFRYKSCYKGVEHSWEPRSPANDEEFQARARLPLVPLVITPQDENLQDSTPIIEKLEARHPSPSILPEDEGLRFLSALLEEFADEWGNKWMFHLRWAREEDQKHTARRLAAGFSGQEDPPAQMVEAVRERMVPRVSFVGSNPDTGPIIEQSYAQALRQLEAHLADRPFLLGSRPGMADFGLCGQLFGCMTDLTAGRLLRETAPAVLAWVERMVEPEVEDGADWESWESLAGTLFPLLKEQVGGLFLPWSDANARALAEGRDHFEVELADGQRWHQGPQKYHARSLGALRQKYAEVSADSWCRGVLADAGCDTWLRAD